MWVIRPRPVERAAASIAAAGAMQSCAMLLRSVHPWGPARPSKRPSQVVTWLLCANAAGRCHERLGGTSGNPRATATAIAVVCIARAYVYTVVTAGALLEPRPLANACLCEALGRHARGSSDFCAVLLKNNTAGLATVDRAGKRQQPQPDVSRRSWTRSTRCRSCSTGRLILIGEV